MCCSLAACDGCDGEDVSPDLYARGVCVSHIETDSTCDTHTGADQNSGESSQPSGGSDTEWIDETAL